MGEIIDIHFNRHLSIQLFCLPLAQKSSRQKIPAGRKVGGFMYDAQPMLPHDLAGFQADNDILIVKALTPYVGRYG